MFQVLSFIHYWLKQLDEHSLHSPFVYDFYTRLIRQDLLADNDIERLRDTLKKTQTEVKIAGYGAGSRISKSKTRSISSIAKHASTPPKFSSLLEKIISHFQLSNIIELGTSLGLNTLYMSKAEGTNITTFEGDKSIADIAQKHFSDFGRTNIKTIIGNIDDTLEPELSRFKKVDLAYLDANHRYAPTLNYYEQLIPKIHEDSIIVIDDIHWSKEMNRAWNEIKNKPEVILSIDLFEAGLLFYNPKLEKADYILKF